ncbi:tyrosine-type recombinase/integrase [Bacillus licheniformis]|uniref:tyrosine-type recombinase/integrase n=1 Tax=Bacillus TaxID=1386 RepID=UPI0022805F56|nr:MULTISPECIES: tyrosine-type recombinase/integrase [Bacillus]MCY7861078.1 tyrosine-type recombinase/integrase [Bacillus haynesii]MCY8015593.1 tyrosine-type recombinase/integrase [Bacillus haynesii]MCY8291591.1 tyrosine-type recombinase/integrase [Bacillus haynesii]MCY8549216.1 tyrosine-type recombinase/integrase [Bacillus haynesii]MCY8745036.1 tyrosine-type recombinase/integrase [Bacillus licheniformis]
MRGSIKRDEKTKKWYYEVTVSRDPVTGKRKRKKKRGFETKKEAESALAKLLTEIESSDYIEPSKILLADYLKDFIKIRHRELEASTFKTERGNLITHVIPELGHLPLSKITSARLQKFVNDLSTEKGLKPSSVKKVFDPLKIALDRAVKLELIAKNPAKAVVLPKITRDEMTVWTKEDVERFLNFAQKDRMFMLFHLALTTGLRQGELLGLRWKDIDMEKGLLRVVQVLTREGELKPRGKTAAATRTVTLMKETIPLLKKHKALLASEKLRAGKDYQDLDLVLPSSKGTPLLPRNTNRTFDRLVREYNAMANKLKEVNKIEVPTLAKIRFHDMRHTHATLLLLADVNPKVVAERLGHSKVSITLDTYSHVLPSMQEGAVEKLSDVMYG